MLILVIRCVLEVLEVALEDLEPLTVALIQFQLNEASNEPDESLLDLPLLSTDMNS
jgi:hypothetical protein